MMKDFYQKAVSFYSQRGVSLYITIVILSIVLAIVLGLTTIIVGQIKTIRTIEYSSKALFAADTGVERALKDIYHNDGSGECLDFYGCSDPALDTNLSYEAFIYCCDGSPDCYFDIVPPGQELPPNCPSELTDPYDDGKGCSAKRFCVKSVGTFKDVKRAIEALID